MLLGAGLPLWERWLPSGLPDGLFSRTVGGAAWRLACGTVTVVFPPSTVGL